MKFIAAALALFMPMCVVAAPLAEIKAHGGLCSYGECKRNAVIDLAGNVTITENGVAPITYKLLEEELLDLKAAIDGADYDAIQSRKFTGTCPTAYDGSEEIYVLYLASGELTLATCTYILDKEWEPFKTLDFLFGRAARQGR